MTQYSMIQVREIWLRNGGSPALSVIAVGVAFAESNGWSDAISPVKDYGLWQINAMHFASLQVTTTSILNPDINAQAAIIISGNGSNWAPWCTCWANPARDCGHGYLPVPQRGSPGYDRMIGAQAVFGTAPVVASGPVSTTGVNAVTNAWSQVGILHGTYARTMYGQLNNIHNAIGSLK